MTTTITDAEVEAAAKALADAAMEPFDNISRSKYIGDARAALTAATAMTTTITDAEVEAAVEAIMDDVRKLVGPYVLETERNSFSRIATLERQLAEAREVIKPFAVMAGQIDEWQNGTDPNCNFQFDANDLRRAREWLKLQTNKHDRPHSPRGGIR